MRALIMVLAVAGACSSGGALLAVNVAAHSGPILGADSCDEACADRESTNRHSAEELGELAIWRAKRGNCTCGYALVTACGRRDLTVRERVVRDPALRSCVEDLSPEARDNLRHDATQPGVIAGCIGDE